MCECQCVHRPRAVGSEAQTDDGSDEDDGIAGGVRGDTVRRAGSGGRCRGVFGRRADLSRPLTSLLETKRTRTPPAPHPPFSLTQRSHTTRTHAHVMYFTETHPPLARILLLHYDFYLFIQLIYFDSQPISCLGLQTALPAWLYQ